MAPTLLRESEIQALGLLVSMEEAMQRGQREPFQALQTDGSHNLFLFGAPGPENTGQEVYPGDIDALALHGFVRCRRTSSSMIQIDVTADGLAFYRSTLSSNKESIERLADAAQRYFDSDLFVGAYRRAHAKWSEAEELLAQPESENAATTVGHLCREALQFFAEDVSRRVVGRADGLPSHTVARLRAVLSSLNFGVTERAFLDALLVYWGTVSDLVQRQEHGASKEGGEVGIEDSRRVLFHSMIVMYEWDRATRRPGVVSRAS